MLRPLPPIRIESLRCRRCRCGGCRCRCRCRRRLRPLVRIVRPLATVGHTVDLLNGQAIVLGHLSIQWHVRVERVHDRVLCGRVAQAERMAELVHGHIHEAGAARGQRIAGIVRTDQPVFVRIEVGVAAAAGAREEGVRQDAAATVKVVVVAVFAAIRRHFVDYHICCQNVKPINICIIKTNSTVYLQHNYVRPPRRLPKA